jgi:hypothetical protein
MTDSERDGPRLQAALVKKIPASKRITKPLEKEDDR